MKKVALIKSNKWKNLRLAILMLYIYLAYGDLLYGTENKDRLYNIEYQYSQWANIFI